MKTRMLFIFALILGLMAFLPSCSDKDTSTSPGTVFNWEGTFSVSSGNGTMELEMPDPLLNGDFTSKIKWEDEDGDYGEGTMQLNKTGDSITGSGTTSLSQSQYSVTINFVTGTITESEEKIEGNFSITIGSTPDTGTYILNKKI